MNSCPMCKASRLKKDFVFCPYCGNRLPEIAACPKCRYQDISNAKFCPECGTQLVGQTNEGSVAEILEELEIVPTKGIVIEFGYSSSQNFDFAVYAAQQFSTFRQIGEGKKAVYRVHLQPEEIEKSLELVNYIRLWKSARVYFDGEKTTFENVFSFIWCYEQRQASFKPELYCFGFEREYDLNLWGCIQARMPFREYADWWQWGEWINKNGDWRFDKERMRHGLQTALFPHRLCPAIQLSLVEEVLEVLPEVVNPRRDKYWKFVESWGEDLSTGLVVTQKRFAFDEKVTMKGVCPKDVGALREIIKRIKRHRLPEEIVRSK
jgi:hypothetical protein